MSQSGIPSTAQEKDFTEWHEIESQIQLRTEIPSFSEGEIWYCSIGKNIGSEQDGKGSGLWKPVVIVKKYNGSFFTGIPLTTKRKKGNHYFNLPANQGFKSVAILSQVRSFSAKRLANRIGILDAETLYKMKKAASEYIFGS